jgi:hypothetical protein
MRAWKKLGFGEDVPVKQPARTERAGRIRRPAGRRCPPRLGPGYFRGAGMRLVIVAEEGKWPRTAGHLGTQQARGRWRRNPRVARVSAFSGHYSAKGPVSRILSCAVIPLGGALPLALISDLPGGFGNNSSRLAASGRCVTLPWLLAGVSLPIWSCSVWGLPCLRHYCRSGALLPHLFTLTPAPVRPPTQLRRTVPGTPA